MARIDDTVISLLVNIIQQEWRMFSTVSDISLNQTACQQDPDTFLIMRLAYLSIWSADFLTAYHQDLVRSTQHHINLVAVKYLRMMDHAYFTKNSLLQRSDLSFLVTKKIMNYFQDWDIEFRSQFPALAARTRAKNQFNQPTSLQYLYAEFSVYSDATLQMCLWAIKQNSAAHKNMILDMLNYTAKLYDFKNITDFNHFFHKNSLH